MISDQARHRRDVWQAFADRLPDLASRMTRGNEHSRWLAVGPRPLVLAHYVADRGVGLFVRGPRGEPAWRVREVLLPHRRLLSVRLGRPDLRLGNRFLLPHALRIDMHQRANWPAAIDWLADRSSVYAAALAELQIRPGGWPDDRPSDAPPEPRPGDRQAH